MNKRRILTIVFAALFMVALAVPCLADTVAAAAADPTFSEASMIDPIKTAIFSVITVDNIVKIVVAAIGGSLAFVLFWFGFRKVKGVIMSAAKRGKLGG